MVTVTFLLPLDSSDTKKQLNNDLLKKNPLVFLEQSQDYMLLDNQ